MDFLASGHTITGGALAQPVTRQIARNRSKPARGHLNTFRALFGAAVMGLAAASQAAPLNLTIPFQDPDIKTSQAKIDYVYTGGGSGGQLTITGKLGGNKVIQEVILAGWMTQSGNQESFFLVNNQSATPTLLTDYMLVANFDDNGDFVTAGSQVTVNGYIDGDATTSGWQPHPQFDPAGSCPSCTFSGIFYQGDLTKFGFVGDPTVDNDADTVTFEWLVNVTGGDVYERGFQGQVGGVIGSGDVEWGTTTGSYGGPWDPSATNDMTAFQTSFASCTGCALQLDTFVPVPAAVWLFGSGLAGLMGVGLRRRKTAG